MTGRAGSPRSGSAGTGGDAEPQQEVAQRLFVSLPGDAGPGPEIAAPLAQPYALEMPSDLRPAIGEAPNWHAEPAPGAQVIEHVLPDESVRLWFDLSGAATEPMVLGPRLDAAMVTLLECMAGLDAHNGCHQEAGARAWPWLRAAPALGGRLFVNGV